MFNDEDEWTDETLSDYEEQKIIDKLEKDNGDISSNDREDKS